MCPQLWPILPRGISSLSVQPCLGSCHTPARAFGFSSSNNELFSTSLCEHVHIHTPIIFSVGKDRKSKILTAARRCQSYREQSGVTLESPALGSEGKVCHVWQQSESARKAERSQCCFMHYLWKASLVGLGHDPRSWSGSVLKQLVTLRAFVMWDALASATYSYQEAQV